MYIPNSFREDDRPRLVAFMRAHSFATLVSQHEGLPFATHLPLAVSAHGNELVITGHLARANPQWHSLAEQTALAIFSGPHAYVSPALYEARESVPTWNYIAVHAYGQAELVTADKLAALRELVESLVNIYEPAYAQQWASLSDRYRDGMLRGIVGFRLHVTRLEGKAKLSQNRSHTDQVQVAEALLQSTDPADVATGEAMQRGLGDVG